MKNLIEILKGSFNTFVEAAEKQLIRCNKAAGTKARACSLKIGKFLKEFRAKSLEESRKKDWKEKSDRMTLPLLSFLTIILPDKC